MSDVATPERAAMRLVPLADTEEMWGGFARAIVMWRDLRDPTGRALYDHLRRSGEKAPDWLQGLIPNIDHVPPKGAVAGAIFRAMVEQAPHGGKVPLKAARDFAWALYEAAHDGLDDADLPALFREHLGLEIAEEER